MSKVSEAIQQLLAIMAKLRDKNTGCPWDLQQTLHSLIPYTIEEVYELSDAVERQDTLELKNELGDLLFHIVFYAQIAKENKQFEFCDIAQAVSDKLIRRHPHVFSDSGPKSVDAVNRDWEKIKAQERRAVLQDDEHKDSGYLDGIAQALPAMIRAEKLQKRVAAIGFDWESIDQVVDKVEEELNEIRDVLAQKKTADAAETSAKLSEELGDLLFSCVNLARFAGLSPESVLRQGNKKFVDRFQKLEKELLRDDKNVETAGAEELNRVWDKVKNDQT